MRVPVVRTSPWGASFLIGVAAGCSGSTEPPTPTSELIFYQSRPNFSGWDLYTITPDGSERIRLTTTAHSEVDPAWAPDRQRFAFAANQSGNFDIYVAQGALTTQITSDPGNERAPAWSSDGQRIAFMSDWEGNTIPGRLGRTFDLYLMEVDGSTMRRLTATPDLSESDPTWSPDGTSIVFSQTRFITGEPETQLYLLNLAGGEPVLVPTSPARNPIEPAWSPDGQLIAFSCICSVGISDDNALWTVNLESGTVTLLRGGISRRPAWSPDGQQLAYAFTQNEFYGRFNDGQIGIIDATGSSVLQLTVGEAPGRWDVIGSAQAWRAAAPP